MISHNKLVEFLIQMRIFDEDGTLSFTSVYLYLGVLICLVQPTTVHVVALLTLILANTNLKRFSRHKAKSAADSADLKVREFEATKATNDQSQDKRIQHLEDEVQKLVQVSNFSRIGK